MMDLFHLNMQKIIATEGSLLKKYNLHIVSVSSVFLLVAVICLYVQPILTGILKMGQDEGTRFFLRSGLFLDDAFYYLKQPITSFIMAVCHLICSTYQMGSILYG